MGRKFMRNKNMIYTFKFQIFVRLKGGSLKKEEGWAEFLKKVQKILYTSKKSSTSTQPTFRTTPNMG